MILPVLIAANAVASSVRMTQRIAYTIVTTAFLFFFTPFYILLLFTDKVGLFVLPTVALLWLMGRLRPDGLPPLAVAHCPTEPISLRAV